MVKTSDLIELVKCQLNVWTGISIDSFALMQYLNMGVSDLYEKFNLSLKIETITVVPEQAVYDLKNDDVNLILRIYNELGEELNSSDVIDSANWDYKLVNYKTFTYHNKDSQEKLLYVLYKAAPIEVKDANDILDIPNSFKEALMLYMMYLGTSTSHSQTNMASNGNQNNNFFALYTQKCAELLQQGYMMPIGSEGMSVIARGFR